MTDLRDIANKLRPGYEALRQATRVYTDLEQESVRLGNRVRATSDPRAHDVLLAVDEAKARARKWLEQIYGEVVPTAVREWQQRTPGVSAYQLGRLLGEAGHPQIAWPYSQEDNPDFDPAERPSATNEKRFAVPGEPRIRSVSEWLQRCGFGRPGRLPKEPSQDEVLAAGLPAAKRIAWLMIAGPGGALFQNGEPDKNGKARAHSPYRAVYDAERARYAASVHTGPCSGGYVSNGARVVFAKCKVDARGAVATGSAAVRYADVGDPYSPGHLLAIGIRHAAKAMLKDLYGAAAL